MSPAMPRQPDTIALDGLRVYGYHGVLDDERRDGQEFVVDVACHGDLTAAASADDLTRTVDYAELAVRLHQAVASHPVDLIETVAQRLADICLTYDVVQAVDVTVHKPAAPIPVPFADVRITIHRSRDD